MSLTISTLFSANLPLKPPHLSFSLSHRIRSHVVPFRSSSIRRQSIIAEQKFHNLMPFSAIRSGFSTGRTRGLSLSAESGGGERESVVDSAEEEARGQSTLPERFRHLTKEAPDRPVRWPWFVAFAFLLYAWRTVLWELYNWRKILSNIVRFIGYLSKLALALIFHFIGDPVTSLIRGIETVLYTIRAFYSAVVAYAPIPELTVIIMLVSSILAIAEASVPNSVDSQPYLLTVAGLIGFAAVRGFISELFFWMLLFGLFGFARFVKKRDYVSSVLPVAAVLAAVGEPWVRFVVMTSYVALAITHRSNKLPSEDREAGKEARKVPVPLFCVALAIGVRVAAKWVGYRHLTWMIV